MWRTTSRILVSSAVVALIIVRATRLVPDPEKAKATHASAPSGTLEARDSLPAAYVVPIGEGQTRRTSRIEHCFTSGFDVVAPSRPGQIAVVTAALKQDWESVRRMLDAGASVETADDTGITPLMAAAMQGNVEMIRMLLERHASPNFTDLAGNSAVHHAIQAGKLEALQELLPVVSHLEAISAAGHDLPTMALETGDMHIFQAVLERLPANLQWTANTRRALEVALSTDLKEQVRLLLSKHPAPPTRDGGTAPLIAYAIANDDAALFHTLLACGSDPNIVIPKVCEKDFMNLLKNKHLRLYIQNETGVNLLMLAAGLGRTDFVRALLDAGADRNRTTPRYKMLPLYFAAWTANWQCVQLLLGGGPLPEQLRVEISLAKQNATVIKDGVTIFSTQVSTGRQGYSTPAGHYVITDKDRDHMSTIYKCPMPYFMRLNCRDFGMHAGVVPTYPASHGCIRLPGDAAKKLFSEIPIGTVVMIN
ncbi:MAG TPA: ankyrin repeat domain-containing protein [Chthoniobacterales bacterium]|nr:ankyrin repeat domain-containing protein [Chthoniobacterales bacterium]